MLVGNIFKEVYLLLVYKEGKSHCVNRRITPTLVIEFACGVEIAEVQVIRGGAEEIEICNLEVRPD